jgi:hypothetical protein
VRATPSYTHILPRLIVRVPVLVVMLVGLHERTDHSRQSAFCVGSRVEHNPSPSSVGQLHAHTTRLAMLLTHTHAHIRAASVGVPPVVVGALCGASSIFCCDDHCSISSRFLSFDHAATVDVDDMVVVIMSDSGWCVVCDSHSAVIVGVSCAWERSSSFVATVAASPIATVYVLTRAHHVAVCVSWSADDRPSRRCVIVTRHFTCLPPCSEPLASHDADHSCAYTPVRTSTPRRAANRARAKSTLAVDSDSSAAARSIR